MTGLKRGQLIVSVPVRRSNRYPGVDVRQKTDLTPDQTTLVGGLPTTTATRTIIDLAQHLGPKRQARLVDSAVAAGLTTFEAIEVLFEHLARRGKPGIRTMRIVMEDRTGKTARPTSVLEARLLELISSSGLPDPTSQFEAPWLANKNGRVDFAYVDHRLVIEADSRRWHAMADAFLTDRERDNRAQLAGWRVLRFTWRDIEERPGYVVSAIREALEA